MSDKDEAEYLSLRNLIDLGQRSAKIIARKKEIEEKMHWLRPRGAPPKFSNSKDEMEAKLALAYNAALRDILEFHSDVVYNASMIAADRLRGALNPKRVVVTVERVDSYALVVSLDDATNDALYVGNVAMIGDALVYVHSTEVIGDGRLIRIQFSANCAIEHLRKTVKELEKQRPKKAEKEALAVKVEEQTRSSTLLVEEYNEGNHYAYLDGIDAQLGAGRTVKIEIVPRIMKDGDGNYADFSGRVLGVRERDKTINDMFEALVMHPIAEMCREFNLLVPEQKVIVPKVEDDDDVDAMQSESDIEALRRMDELRSQFLSETELSESDTDANDFGQSGGETATELGSEEDDFSAEPISEANGSKDRVLNSKRRCASLKK